MPLSVVIPTYQREQDLKECLDSILGQTLLPAEIIVIDDGELGGEYLAQRRSECEVQGVRFVYYKKDHAVERRGLSESKNRALELVSEPIVCFFDDDVVLESDCLEKMSRVWDENHDAKLIGVGGMISNNRRQGKFEKLFAKFWKLDGKFSWDVTDVGFQVWDESIRERTKGFYTHGGVTSYRTDLVRQLRFATFGGGRTGLEDVEFCLRAKQLGFCFIMEPAARVFHKGSVVAREKHFVIGKKESVNRKVIFRTLCKQDFCHWLWFWWSMKGWILRQVLAGHFEKAGGMVVGLFV